MSPRRLSLFLLPVVLAVAAWLLWPRQKLLNEASRSDATAQGTKRPGSSPAPLENGVTAKPPAPATPESLAADFPMAAPLNAPDSTIARDLDTIRLILEGWRSNFPREGNPVGENHEITAALTGDNRLSLVLIPQNHPALNAQGELCDRWGTPFRFHQLSGEKMEIRSAGPDRKFGTADDALWSPEPP